MRSWQNFQISFAAHRWKYCEVVDPWTVHELYPIPQIIATRVIIYSSWFICKSMQTKERPFWNFIPEKPLTENLPFLGASQPGVILLLLFVITIKLTRWSANLSPSHSYVSFGIICGPSWGSFAVLYSVERNTKSVKFAIFSYNNDNEWFSSNVRLSYEHRIMGSPGGKHWKSIQRNVWLGALCIYLPL